MTFERRFARPGAHHDVPAATHATPGKHTLTEDLAAPGPALPGHAAPGALPAPVRAKMEHAFGADFSAVRIHEGPQAAAMNAIAYTEGNDIHFQPGRYDPTSASGQALLGHELTHVVQQRGGQVRPQGKDAPINADPALEAEADDKGARAARGEHVGGGTGATQVQSKVIQRYAEVTDDYKRKWRKSDDGGMLVESTGTPGYRSKEFFATPAKIAAASAQLSSAGSFIRLEASYAGHGRSKVLPRFVSPGAEHGQVFDNPGPTSGSSMVMPSDCNNSARLIMGVQHAPTQTDMPPPSQDAETNVSNQGSTPRKEFLVKAAKGDEGPGSLVENNGLTQLTDSLVKYRGVVAERPVAKQDANGLQQVLARSAALANTNHADAWRVLNYLKVSLPAFYADFTGWAGLDAGARPDVGDALVTYLPDGPVANSISKNPKAYDAMVDALRSALTDKTDREAIRSSLEAVLKSVKSEHAVLLAELEATRASEEKKKKAKEDELEEARSLLAGAEGDDRKPHQLRITRLTSDIKYGFQALIEKAEKAEQLARGTMEHTRAIVEMIEVGKAPPDAVARAALELIGITAGTLFSDVKTTLNQTDKATQHFGKGVERRIHGAMGDNDLWNKHWGGVVMTEGSDYVTLENDASTRAHGAMNTEWGFALYGSEKPGQSFHDQMTASGDFGSFASTARMTGPKTTENKAQQGRDGDRNVVQTFDQSIDAKISAIGDDQEPLLDLLLKLRTDQRAALKRRYQARAPHPAPVAKLTLRLIDELAPRQELPRTMRTGPDPGDQGGSEDWGGPGHDPSNHWGKNHPLGQSPGKPPVA